MANNPSVILGVAEVRKFLTDAPALIVAKGFIKALKAASKPVDEVLAGNTPRGVLTASTENTLAESQVTEILLSSDLKGGSFEVGFGKQSHVANLVEFGHEIVGHAPGKKRTGKRAIANPFIRRSFETSAPEAIEAFVDSLMETINEVL